MIGQLAAIVIFTGLVLFLKRDYAHNERIQRQRHAEFNQETVVQFALRAEARTGDVTAAPVNCPVYPLEFARSRREQRTFPGDAA